MFSDALVNDYLYIDCEDLARGSKRYEARAVHSCAPRGVAERRPTLMADLEVIDCSCLQYTAVLTQ